MNNSKYKLVIFETNISDGVMSPNKKFYSKDYTDKRIEEEFLNTRLKVGKKYGFDGRKILHPSHIICYFFPKIGILHSFCI